MQDRSPSVETCHRNQIARKWQLIALLFAFPLDARSPVAKPRIAV